MDKYKDKEVDEYSLRYAVKHIDYRKDIEDVQECRWLNNYDIYIIFKDGDKSIYDMFTNTFRGVYPEGHELTDTEMKREFARRLYKMIQRSFIDQEELAKRVGTSQTMISHYSTGRCVPNCIMLGKIARALNCSVNDFYYDKL